MKKDVIEIQEIERTCIIGFAMMNLRPKRRIDIYVKNVNDYTRYKSNLVGILKPILGIKKEKSH